MGSLSQSGNRSRSSFRKETGDEPVLLPSVNKGNLMERFKRTLIGRIFNSDGRSTEAIIAILPRPHIWDVEGRVRGFDLGNGRFQFDFDSEEDLRRVLNKRPCHINRWSIALERWEPNIRGDFPNRISFWVQIKGLNPEHLNEEAFRRLGDFLGLVVKVDENSKKMLISVDATKPLIFEKKTLTEEGEEATATFKYERLYRYCFYCRMINHEERSCPELSEEDRFKRKAERAVIARKEAEEEEELLKNQRSQQFSVSRPALSPDYRGKDSHRDNYHQPRKFAREEERRYSRPSPRHDEKERNHISTWQRVEPNREPYYPRNRETSNSSFQDERKRRHDESVATSSWRPKYPAHQDHDYRYPKYQRLNQESFRDDRDMRNVLDKKRDPHHVYREGNRRSPVKTYSPRRRYDPQLLNVDKSKGRVDNGSKTVIASDSRRPQAGGTVYYRVKAPKQGTHEKSAEREPTVKEAVTLDPKKVITPALKETPPAIIQESNTKNVALQSEEEEGDLQKEMNQNTTPLTEEEEEEQLEKNIAECELLMQQDEVENDDLLDDEMQISGEHTISDQIKPVAHREKIAKPTSLSPLSARISPPRRPAKERIEYPKIPLAKSANRKRKTDAKRRMSKNPRELLGISSKKRNAIQINGSPKKVSSESNQQLQLRAENSKTGISKSNVPHTGVFPSAISKKIKSLSGSVVSQKPPSKDI